MIIIKRVLKNRILKINLLIGFVLLTLPIISSPHFNRGLDLFAFKPFLRNFISYIFLVIGFFLNFYVFIPKLYLKNKIFIYVVVSLIYISLISILPQIIFGHDSLPPHHHNHSEKTHTFYNFLNPRNALIFESFMVWILCLLMGVEKKYVEIKNQKLISEISYLKAQINPHFLFNTLNNIYALTLTKSEKAPEVLIKLSSIMRYVVTESCSENDKVLLKKELKYIADYIDLQKIRISKNVNLNFKVNGEITNQMIAPIILITFIENAFKYGVNTEKTSDIDIIFNINNNILDLEVINDVVINESNIGKTSKVGVDNTIKRLDYYYQDKYQIKIYEQNNKHYVLLNLRLS